MSETGPVSKMPESTRLQILSDLHIERCFPTVPRFEDFEYVGSDTCVLAGDVGRTSNWLQYVAFIARVCDRFKRVILIAGNHEYYSSILDVEYIKKELMRLTTMFPNLVFLDDSYIELHDCVVFGTTLWTQLPHGFDLSKYHYPIVVENSVGDRHPITSEDWNYMHATSLRALPETMTYAMEKNKPLIVISHFSPVFEESLRVDYVCTTDAAIAKKNHLYCNRLYHMLKKENVHTWVYGHTGQNADYVSPRGTRVVSRQLDLDTKHGKQEPVIVTPS